MSKSNPAEASRINVLDSPDEIARVGDGAHVEPVLNKALGLSSRVESARFQRLKLTYNQPLSSFIFNFKTCGAVQVESVLKSLGFSSRNHLETNIR